jgi:hypothetical protein
VKYTTSLPAWDAASSWRRLLSLAGRERERERKRERRGRKKERERESVCVKHMYV